MRRLNPRTFVADAADRRVSSLSELIGQLARHPGLRRRDPRKYAQRWAHRLGLLGRWRKEAIEAAKLKKATEEAVKAQKEADRLKVREAALRAARVAAGPIIRAVPQVSGMLDIASQFLMPDQPKAPTSPKQLSRKERRDLQFGRAKSEQS
jgi:hypothetical protein